MRLHDSNTVRVGREKGDYINSDQRNVHIWASRIDSKDGTQYAHLLAGNYGFYNNSDKPGRRGITWKVVHQWLDMILANNDDAQGNITTSWVIVPSSNLSKELQPGGLKDVLLIKSKRTTKKYLEKERQNWKLPKESVCEAGHYVLFTQIPVVELGRATTYDYLAGKLPPTSSPLPTSVKFQAKSTAKSPVKQAGVAALPANESSEKEKTSRNATARKRIRDRDMMCRATGDEVPERNRGYDFVGFECAHIFPFANLGIEALDMVMESHMEDARKFLSTVSAGDHHMNGLLLRVDIHRCFDDYQFSIYPDPKDGNIRKVYTFEKIIPPFLETIKEELLPPKNKPKVESKDDPLNDVFDWLLLEHFRTALLWHVAGLGQKAKVH